MDPVSFAVPATIVRADVPLLCAELARLLAGRTGGVVVCDVAAVPRPDVVTVEALARLRLTARRLGWTLVVRGAGPRLRELLSWLALADALPQVGGEVEVREQPGGVEERVDRGDPAA
jgi:hypothetical protein